MYVEFSGREQIEAFRAAIREAFPRRPSVDDDRPGPLSPEELEDLKQLALAEAREREQARQLAEAERRRQEAADPSIIPEYRRAAELRRLHKEARK